MRRFTPSSIVFDANLPTLLIVASLAFLFIAVAGSVAGKIDPGKGGRIGAGLIGAVLLVLGIVLKVATPGSESAEPKEGAHAELASEATGAPEDDARRAEEPQLEQERAAIQAAQIQPAGGVRFFGDLLYLNGRARLPLAGARVELRAPGASEPLYFTTSNEAGRYSFPKVPPGNYQVSVRHEDAPLTVLQPAKPIQVRQVSGGRRLHITVER